MEKIDNVNFASLKSNDVENQILKYNINFQGIDSDNDFNDL